MENRKDRSWASLWNQPVTRYSAQFLRRCHPDLQKERKLLKLRVDLKPKVYCVLAADQKTGSGTS